MDSAEREAFAPRLRRLRTAAGLTQQELADRAGVSVRAISDLERQINERPRRDTAVMSPGDSVAVARALHVGDRRSATAARNDPVSLFAAFGSVE